MPKPITQAIQEANDAANTPPQSDQPQIVLESAEIADLLQRIHQNTTKHDLSETDKRLRPNRTQLLDVATIAAGEALRLELPAGTRSIEIWNETAQTIRRSFVDRPVAGCGSMPIPAGQGRQEDIHDHEYVWIYSTAAAGINNGSANGITIEVGL